MREGSRVGALQVRSMYVALGASLAFLAGYLVDSVPLGLLIARAVSGIDIRRYGTGGVGASNVRQNVGTLWAAIVMLGLFLQGFLPPLAVRLADAPDATVVAAALGAVVGYNWSVFLGFKVEGARGVGISTGAAAVLCPSGLLPLYIRRARSAPYSGRDRSACWSASSSTRVGPCTSSIPWPTPREPSRSWRRLSSAGWKA